MRAAAKEVPVATDDLREPEGLSDKGRAAYVIIKAILRKHEIAWTGGCRTFYSPAEWRERGEKYGGDAELIVVYDGSDVGATMKIDGALYEETRTALGGLAGLFAEECTHWYAAIYPVGGAS